MKEDALPEKPPIVNPGLRARSSCRMAVCLAFLFVFVAHCPVKAQTPKPILVSMPTTLRAVAIDAVGFSPEPFFSPSRSPLYGSDKNTRVMLFAMNLSLSPGEDASAVTADLQDASQNHYSPKVEYVGPIPGMAWVTQITLRLGEMGDVGDVLVKITHHGLSSNRVRVAIGHIGGGPNDDPGSTSTPLPPYTIGGRIMEGTIGFAGAAVTLTGPEGGTKFTDSLGNYSFTVQTPGDYALHAAKQFYTLAPADILLNNLTVSRTLNLSASRTMFAIGGQVRDDHGNGLENVSVSLKTGSNEQLLTTGSGGSFSFTGVLAGFSYLVTPVNTNLFAFTSQSIPELNGNSSLSFNGTLRDYAIRGTIADRSLHGVSGVSVTLSGAANMSATTDANGAYAFNSLPAGRSYGLAVAKVDHIFEPAVRNYELLHDENADFTAIRQYRLSGRIVDSTGRGLMGVKVNLTGAETSSVRTPVDGSYSFTVTTPGDYQLSPAQQYYQFAPANQILPQLSDHQTVNFTGGIVITGPTSVLEFDGSPSIVDYGFFWPPDTNVGHFFWEFWAMPGNDAYARYMLTDGYGGAHVLLFGFNYNDQVYGHYSLLGNIWTDTGVLYFNSDEGPSPGEWGHYAVGWDGQNIITYYDGVPVGKQFFTGPRVSTGLYNGSTLLMIGGSDHQNFIGRIAQVRGYEENNPRQASPESAFVPQTVFSVEGQLLSYYFQPTQGIADLSYGYNGVQHAGWPRNILGFYFYGCDPCIPPRSVIDPTAPDFSNPSNSVQPTTFINPPPSTPADARAFDSFSRNNATYILNGLGGLGSTESGSAGTRIWQSGISAGQQQPFGILNGRAVLLANAMAITWVDSGGDGNQEVRVNRTLGQFGSGRNTGLCFRVVDKDNFFFAYSSDDPVNGSNPKQLTVGYYQGGTRTVLASGITIPSQNWTTLRVVTTAAGAINVYAGNTLLYSTTNTINASAAGAGLYNNSSGLSLTNRWDDFTVLNIP